MPKVKRLKVSEWDAERLRCLRVLKRVSASEVSLSLGLSRSAYSRYETGVRAPGIYVLKQLCLYYGCSVDYLLGMTDSLQGSWLDDEKGRVV